MNEPYYSRKYVGFLLLEEAQKREIAILPALRGAQLRSLDELNNNLKLVNWNNRKLSLYVSISKLKKIKNFTFDLRKRSSETHQWFTDEYQNDVIETDLFFDFDSDEISKAHTDAKLLKEYLDSYEVPYQIIFSGSKGFHIIIDGKYIQGELSEGSIYPHKSIVENIKESLNLDTLDLANNGLYQRLRKLAYSLVLPKQFKNTPEVCQENIMRVALPLDDAQFNSFKVEDALLINVLKNIKLIRRGNLERFSNLSLEEKKKNVQKFIKEFNFK